MVDSVVGYKNSLEHIQEELQRLACLIHFQILKFRERGRGGSGSDHLGGLCIQDDEIDAILSEVSQAAPVPSSQEEDPAYSRPLLDAYVTRTARISDRKAASAQEGTVLALERLKALFRLSAFDVDALLVFLAPEIDLRYEKLYAYLQDDVTQRRLSVACVLNLLCPSFEARLNARQRFTPVAPLMWHALLTPIPELPGQAASLLAHSMKVDERIVQELLGVGLPDPRLLPLLRWEASHVPWERLVLSEEVKGRLEKMMGWLVAQRASLQGGQGRPEGTILYFHGAAGAGKQTVAGAVCQRLGLRLLVMDVERLLHGEIPFPTAVRLIFREVLLQQAALYVDHFDLLLVEEGKVRLLRKTFLEEMGHLTGLLFLSGREDWMPEAPFTQNVFIRMAFPVPTETVRQSLWRAALDGSCVPSLDVEALANRFCMGAGQIHHVVAAAKDLALGRDFASGPIGADDLQSACKAYFHQQVSALVTLVQPGRRWDEMVLPKTQMDQLRGMVSWVKYRNLVYKEWGFERRLSLGKGLNALFSGPSGTGKTMAAEVVAGELGLDLYKIDLSMIVSKYIGETEKNLGRVFQEARDSRAILFFDEADAIFGKRSEVKEAHDRYANIEIGYLLQKMEEHDGVVVLATNLSKNMDEAFLRRIQFTIEFPHPDAENRRRIWEGMLPDALPLASDVDLGFLAQSLRLTGGHIRNVVMAGAFLAAANGKVVTMMHLMQAARQEYQKMGWLCTKADFGPYHSRLEETRG